MLLAEITHDGDDVEVVFLLQPFDAHGGVEAAGIGEHAPFLLAGGRLGGDLRGVVEGGVRRSHGSLPFVSGAAFGFPYGVPGSLCDGKAWHEVASGTMRRVPARWCLRFRRGTSGGHGLWRTRAGPRGGALSARKDLLRASASQRRGTSASVDVGRGEELRARGSSSDSAVLGSYESCCLHRDNSFQARAAVRVMEPWRLAP